MYRSLAVALVSFAVGGLFVHGTASAEPTAPWSCYNPDAHPTALGSDARKWGSVQKMETTLNAVAPTASASDVLVVTGLGIQKADTVVCVRNP